MQDSSGGDAAATAPPRSLGIVDVLGSGEKCGYLRKNSARKRNVWRRRWCVVKDGRLYYCKDRHAQHELSYISLADSIVRDANELSVPHSFEVHTATMVHQLCAENATELAEWLAVLRAQVELASDNDLLGAAELLICDQEHALAARDGRALALAESSLEGLLCHPRGYELLATHGHGPGSGGAVGAIAGSAAVALAAEQGEGASSSRGLRKRLAFLSHVQRFREQCELCRGHQSGGGGGQGGVAEAWRLARMISTQFLEGQVELDSFARASALGRASTIRDEATASARAPPAPPTDLFDELKFEVLRRLERHEYQSLLHSPDYKRLLMAIPLDRGPTLTASYTFAAQAAIASARAEAQAEEAPHDGECPPNYAYDYDQ
eukprot:g5654.t1